MSEPSNAADPCFEDALTSLEQIVAQLEDGQIGLAEALSRYEQGVKLLKQCYELLARAERRIELLSCIGPEGQAVTEAFDEGPASLEEKARRSGRRSRAQAARTDAVPPAQPPETDMDEPGRLF